MKAFYKIAVFVFLLLGSAQTHAQCAMCRAALETGGDTSQAEAVNDGIIYLMVLPYLLAILVGVAIYRLYNKKYKNKEAQD
jgi:hypothetical protein